MHGIIVICCSYKYVFILKFTHFFQVDLATVMAEMYQKGDADKNEKLELKEFIRGMMDHPVTSKIMSIKNIDALLELM